MGGHPLQRQGHRSGSAWCGTARRRRPAPAWRSASWAGSDIRAPGRSACPRGRRTGGRRGSRGRYSHLVTLPKSSSLRHRDSQTLPPDAAEGGGDILLQAQRGPAVGVLLVRLAAADHDGIEPGGPGLGDHLGSPAPGSGVVVHGRALGQLRQHLQGDGASCRGPRRRRWRRVAPRPCRCRPSPCSTHGMTATRRSALRLSRDPARRHRSRPAAPAMVAGSIPPPWRRR